MGKAKVKIERLEEKSKRQVTYSKRRSGILKKAKEISILCDADLALVMFSPTGKPSVCLGERSNMDEVIGKFARVSPEERAKRKQEGLVALEKAFKKANHQINIQDFLRSSSDRIIEDLNEESKSLQTKVEDTHTRLSRWRDPDEIIDMEHLKIMEESLRKSLGLVCARKENFPKPVMPSECPNQFENGIQLPPSIDEENKMAWLHGNNVGQPFLSENMEPFLQSNMDYTSFGTTSYDRAFASTFQIKEQNDQLRIEAQREQTQLTMNARSQMLSRLMTMLKAPLPSCSNRWEGPKHDDHSPGAGGQGCVT